MRNHGDITQIRASAVEPVNVIIGGSPCQDLSVAGKQAGLQGARSGLFMEQLRIIKEMREITNGEKPRYMVWENVPGAFSSPKGNKGADFQALLEEIIKIVESEAPPIPIPRYGWPSTGCLTGMAGKWSVAWRVFDAQFWGVPQRRKRIALVADFRGESAPEILFDRKRVSGDVEPSGEKEHRPADPTGGRADATGGAICIQGNAINRSLTAGCNGKGFTEEVCYTLNTVDRPAVAVFSPGEVSRIGKRFYWEDAPSPTLRAEAGGNRPAVIYQKGTRPHDKTEGQGYREAKIAHCLNLFDVGKSRANEFVVDARKNAVRRLTPLEHERLQGYPDGWTDIGEWTDEKGKRHKESTDAARYKAIGNSIALPPWHHVLQRLILCCGTDTTMASLFDGIGGFPLLWERLNGKGTCLWASEIAAFPIAVTKRRFNDNEGVHNDTI